VSLTQWSSPKPPKPDPDSLSDIQRRNGLMSAHQLSLNHHQHQQQTTTSSSSRLAVQGPPGPGTDSTLPGYQQQLAGVDATVYPPARPMCAAYNGDVTPTAAHQGSATAAYNPSATFGSARASQNASATPGHNAVLGAGAGATAHAAASYCMPMGSLHVCLRSRVDAVVSAEPRHSRIRNLVSRN